jgi:flagellar biosynthesis/type III secretory pathway protein FliH
MRQDRDQYVYSNPGIRHYRVYRNGGYFETDQSGIDLLQQAVNSGYQEGVRAGQLDRRYGRGSDYNNSAEFRSGIFGYGGSYVSSSEYQYYFREGFRRGYEDGYDSRWQYGSYSNGGFSILGSILQQLLSFQAY